MTELFSAESGGFYPRIQGDAGERKIMNLSGCTTDDTACAGFILPIGEKCRL